MNRRSTLLTILVLINVMVVTGFTAWMSSAAGIDAVKAEKTNKTNHEIGGSYDFKVTVTETQWVAYLPIINNRYCPDFEDDFSYPFSGWPVGEDSFVLYEYLNDEYRVLNKKPGFFFFFDSPSCARENYTVEVDARWAGTPGQSYGIVFGILGDFEEYYIFDVNSDFKLYRLLRHDSGGTTTIAPTGDAPSMNGGTGSNHLEVIRNGSDITLTINGAELGTWSDSAISGLTRAGVLTSPYDKGPLGDARFDNFRMANFPSNKNGFGVNNGRQSHLVFRENNRDYFSTTEIPAHFPN